MVNKRGEPVSYRPFATKGAAAEGLLPVARELLNGDVERRLAQGWFRLAGLAGEFADRAAYRDGEKWAAKERAANAPGQVVVEGGSDGKLPLPEGTTRPFKTSDPVAQGLEPHQMALLNAIAGGESGGNYNIRYTPQGGVLFDDVSKHPRIMEPTRDGQKSSAAGRYQFTATTWEAMGGGDFSPENQDRRALQLATQVYRQTTGRDLDADLKAGGLTGQIINALGGTWEAFRQGADRHIATYNDSLARYQRGSGAGEPVLTAAQMAVAAPAIEPVVMKIEEGGKQEAVSGDKPRTGNGKQEAVSGGTPRTGNAKSAGFKPMRGNSVFERGYNAAGTRTYLQQLNVAIQADVLAVYDKLGSDPVEFDKGLAALKKLHLEEHGVPDEIRADYDAAFAKASLPFQRQARLEQKKRIEDQNKADFSERINVLETDLTRRLAVLSYDNEDAVDGLWQVQESLDDHYDAAVLHGVMSATQAANHKIVSRRGLAVQFYEKQAEGKSAAEIKAMTLEMRSDFAAGKLGPLDGEGWRQLENNLKARERVAESGSKKRLSDYIKRGQNMLTRIELGYDIDGEALAQFALDQNGVEDGEKLYSQFMEQITIARAIRDKTMGQARDYVREIQAGLGDKPSDEQIANYHYAQAALEKKQAQLAQDPLAYAEAQRLIAPLDNVLEDMSPEGISAAVGERLAAGRQVAAHFGIEPRFFKAGEVEEIGKYVAANPEHGAMLAAAVVQAAGDDVAAVLREFGDKAAPIYQAGAIMAMGGDNQAAVDVIYGAAEKDEDGRGYKIVGPEKRQAWDAETLGSAVDWLPEDRERMSGAAYAITKRQIYQRGVDVNDDEAVGEIYREALQLAAGQVKIGNRTYGGITRIRAGLWGDGYAVKVMPQIRAERMEALLYAIKLSDFDGAEIKPVQGDGKTPLVDGNWWQLYPVEVEGGYRFSDGDPTGGTPLWIMGSDGRPFVYNPLDYKDRLAVRVPGAFRP